MSEQWKDAAGDLEVLLFAEKQRVQKLTGQLTKAREALRDILDIASGEIPDTFEELDEASANVQAVAQNTLKALDEGSEG